MIEFSEDQVNAKTLAIHYAKKMNDSFFLDFILSRADITNEADAVKISDAFWELTDLAVEDQLNNVEVEGIIDLEYWMLKLFNAVMGYITKRGYDDTWLNYAA
ncbi:hypothetical protein BTA51_03745 [Hahella sp. CCB-MM4]|uniref:hypothetical protein n=1 Tax=Hahella sp. (strain CCB-MM4) TaxID=1926491 RepID=UPI000B9C4444|nr:hypothetical protein [Hahella sp. CCB-MM4]OZG74147.1 hypothetical protein BTA51_03745 [Hahella sp. CCB-MM4]